MKICLTNTKWLHLVFRRTVDKNVIARSRRPIFWLFLGTALFNGVMLAYLYFRGSKDALIVGTILTAVFVLGTLILGVRILKSGSGFCGAICHS
jgi:hypothetical protein